MAANAAPLRPRKRFGQHFLVDPGARGRIVAALGPAEGDPVLEIGPGRGALTASLVETFGRVAAIEIDRDLARALRARFGPGELALLEGDVLEFALREVGELLGAPAAPLRVVGNLPYNVSKPVADKLVRERAHVARAVLMFQREVASRLTARPGGKAYGPLTVLVGEAFDVARAFDLPPAAFRPAPKVTSTVTVWTPRAHAFEAASEGALRRALAAGFAQRRRTLRNNLQRALGAAGAGALLRDAAIDGELRAEAIEPSGWLRLAALWPEAAA